MCKGDKGPIPIERVGVQGSQCGPTKVGVCRLATPLGSIEKDHYSICGFPNVGLTSIYAHKKKKKKKDFTLYQTPLKYFT